MANSLEVRAPFLDHLLVEFAASLPPEMKRKNLTTKYILKQTLRRLLPVGTLSRPKHGFSVPISRWLREDLKAPLVELLLDQRSLQRGYFKPKAIRTLIDEHLQGRMDHGDRLWALLNLELWHRTYMDVVADTPISW
jgi:asparagine synthase (glutamine-hydrolysing)